MDNISALNAFMCAAEKRSFTEAGKHLKLTPSAIGKVIARLEERHGVRLFNRNTRCMTLTQEGQFLQASCEVIFAELKKVEQEFASAKAGPKGRLRVKLPLFGIFMTPCLNKFMQAYPDLGLDLDFSDHSVDVIDGGYDVVVQTGEAPDSRLIVRTIGMYRLVIVGSPGYLSRFGMPKAAEDLASHSCFFRKCLATGKLERWPVSVSSSEEDASTPTRGVTSAFENLIGLAELGAGLVCVPDFLVQRQIKTGSLVSVLTEEVVRTEKIRAVWPSNRYASPKLKVFIDFLAKYMLPPDHLSDGTYPQPRLAKAG